MYIGREMAELMYYTFDQNNSGGRFVVDKTAGVGEVVIIQAYSEETAIARLNSIGEKVSGFWEFCECCGERWSTWGIESGAVPTRYGKPLDGSGKRAFIHEVDETFKEIPGKTF